LEAYYYVHDVLQESPGHKLLKDIGVNMLTSDYVLYWFDYLGGYDVMLTQLGWNHSTVQDIALVKGAARLQDKSWGSIITWKYDEPPYLDSGEEIYNQMVQSYQAGARYIMIFNYHIFVNKIDVLLQYKAEASSAESKANHFSLSI
jgi:hypothetical protein